MKKLVLLFIIIYITYCSFGQIEHTIPIESKNNRTYISVRIGELVITDVLLDTGFSFDGLMLFDPSYMDSLDISNASRVQIGGAGSGDDAGALLIDSTTFSLGKTAINNQPVIILSQSPGFMANGLIGYSIFGHFITEFDYDMNLMVLHDTGWISLTDEWSRVPIYFKNNNIPWLNASVSISDEKPVQLSMYIDFAAGDELVMLEKPDMKFTLPSETEDFFLGRGLSGDIYGKKGRVSRVIIGEYELKDLEASFAPAEVRSRQDNADAILGNRFLKRFNIIFDYNRRELFLKPNSRFSDIVN